MIERREMTTDWHMISYLVIRSHFPKASYATVFYFLPSFFTPQSHHISSHGPSYSQGLFHRLSQTSTLNSTYNFPIIPIHILVLITFPHSLWHSRRNLKVAKTQSSFIAGSTYRYGMLCLETLRPAWLTLLPLVPLPLSNVSKTSRTGRDGNWRAARYHVNNNPVLLTAMVSSDKKLCNALSQ